LGVSQIQTKLKTVFGMELLVKIKPVKMLSQPLSHQCNVNNSWAHVQWPKLGQDVSQYQKIVVDILQKFNVLPQVVIYVFGMELFVQIGHVWQPPLH